MAGRTVHDLDLSDKLSDQMGRVYGEKTAVERDGERRARLVEAALDLFYEVGYASTSIEQLCARANVSTRSFYDHFSSREELLITLHDDLNARALHAVGEAVAAADPVDLAARALAGVRAYFDVVTSDPRWARIAVVDSVGVSAAAERHRQEALTRFAALIEVEIGRLAAAGLVPKRDYRLTAIALVGAILGLVNTWTTVPDWSDQVDAVIDEAAALIVAATTR